MSKEKIHGHVIICWAGYTEPEEVIVPPEDLYEFVKEGVDIDVLSKRLEVALVEITGNPAWRAVPAYITADGEVVY